MSSVATQFLFCDLELDFEYYDKDDREQKLNAFEAVAMCDGLRFVKRLKVGPIKGKMFPLFDRLIFRLPDHSLLDFEWDADAPPLNSQLAYIWDHQSNIRSIDLTDVMDVIKVIQPRGNLKFAQKYENMSLAFPLDEAFLARLDLSCMRTLTMDRVFDEQLPSPISDHLVYITNLQLHSVDFVEGELELDQIASLVSLGLYGCDGTITLLSNFKNPKLKDFRTECLWDSIETEIGMTKEYYNWDSNREFEAPFSFIRRFRGLETLVITMPDCRHPGIFLRDLTDSISSKHNDTLRRLALTDACRPIDRGQYLFDTTESRNSVYDAVMVCHHLVELELPTEWKTKETDFKVCVPCIFETYNYWQLVNGKQRIIDKLPSLKILCLQFHLPWNPPMEFYIDKKPPFQLGLLDLYEVAASVISNLTETSSKLRLLCFDVRGCPLLRRYYLRGWSDSKPSVSVGCHPISRYLVKYHIPGYEPLPTYARDLYRNFLL